jgi:hypothetical protein
MQARRDEAATLMIHRLKAVTGYFDGVLALACQSDIVGRLHAHKRVHLHTESFFNTQSHVSRQIGLAVQETGKGGVGRATPSTLTAAVTDKPVGSMISVRIKLPG